MGRTTNNRNLHNSMKNPNDEFYTPYDVVKGEVSHYEPQLKGKRIICNCDDAIHSAFSMYFIKNFKSLGIESLSYLRKSDIVVTNPHFSLFGQFIDVMLDEGKDFLIIGNTNSIICNYIFPSIQNDKVRIGYLNGTTFFKTDDGNWKDSTIMWYTTLSVTDRCEPLELTKIYSPKQYPKLDNIDAIEVSKTVDIPMDYFGLMCVPITFIDKYHPEQFKIVGKIKPKLNGKNLYSRLIIKRIEKVGE